MPYIPLQKLRVIALSGMLPTDVTDETFSLPVIGDKYRTMPNILKFCVRAGKWDVLSFRCIHKQIISITISICDKFAEKIKIREQ